MECQALRKPLVNVMYHQFMAWSGEEERKKKKIQVLYLYLGSIKVVAKSS